MKVRKSATGRVAPLPSASSSKSSAKKENLPTAARGDVVVVAPDSEISKKMRRFEGIVTKARVEKHQKREKNLLFFERIMKGQTALASASSKALNRAGETRSSKNSFLKRRTHDGATTSQRQKIDYFVPPARRRLLTEGDETNDSGSARTADLLNSWKQNRSGPELLSKATIMGKPPGYKPTSSEMLMKMSLTLQKCLLGSTENHSLQIGENSYVEEQLEASFFKQDACTLNYSCASDFWRRGSNIQREDDVQFLLSSGKSSAFEDANSGLSLLQSQTQEQLLVSHESEKIRLALLGSAETENEEVAGKVVGDPGLYELLDSTLGVGKSLLESEISQAPSGCSEMSQPKRSSSFVDEITPEKDKKPGVAKTCCIANEAHSGNSSSLCSHLLNLFLLALELERRSATPDQHT